MSNRFEKCVRIVTLAVACATPGLAQVTPAAPQKKVAKKPAAPREQVLPKIEDDTSAAPRRPILPDTFEDEEDSAQAPSGDYDPFAQMQQMEARMNQMMQQFLSDDPFAGFPSPHALRAPGLRKSTGGYQLQDEGDHLVFTMALPGMKRDQLNWTVGKRQVTVESKQRSEESRSGAGANQSSRYVGESVFKSVVGLPEEVDPARVKAAFKDGTLRLTLPKAAAASTPPAKEEAAGPGTRI